MAEEVERERLDVDILFIGAGPATLASVIRLSELCKEHEVEMPAVLVETAYISNPNDEKNLNTPAFRDKLAEAIASGIIKYIEQYNRKLASGS